MADQKPKSDLKLRLRMLEKQMDNLVDRFDASNLLLLDLMARIGKIEVWCKQMQEDGRFVYDLEMQENASLDKKAEPTQVLGETMGKQDESVHEAAESKCRVVEEGDIIEFEKKMQEVSSAMESLEGLLEVNLLFQSLRSTEGASQEAEGIIQNAGISKDGSVNERKEFKDENREQEEVRQLENPDESGESVQDLNATSVKEEQFGQGTEEMGDDCVKLDASKEFETRVSERIRLEEEVEDSKIGDEEGGNDCELELLEVDGGNEERRLAEEVGKQEDAVRSEAEDEEGTEHGDISEPAKMEECIGEAKLESSEKVEKSLSGERRKEEELAKSRAMDEENQEKNYELQLACIEECIEEVSEEVERGLSEEAGREEEAIGSKIEVEEKTEDEYELGMSGMEKGFTEVSFDTSKDSEDKLSDQGKQRNVIQSKKIEETLKLIALDIEEEINMRLSDKLRENVGERIRKLIDSSVMEINQEVRALEREVTEQNLVRCSIQGEVQRLQTELLKAVRRNNLLKLELSDVQEILNAELIKQREFEKFTERLVGKYREEAINLEEGMSRRSDVHLEYTGAKSSREQLKAKHADGNEQTGQVDMGTGKEKKGGKISVETIEKELASYTRSEWDPRDTVMRAVETSPLEVEKVVNAEWLDECRRKLLEDMQKNPDKLVYVMEAILRNKKKEHDYFWKGIVNEVKLSLCDVAGAGCPLLAKLIVEYGVSCNAADREGNTPLHHAAMNGNVDIGKVLLQAGSYVNIQNLSKATPLHIALKHKNTDFSLLLLMEEINLDISDVNGNTPLHLATLMGNAVIVSQLIESEADVNAVDHDGDTPIFNAAIAGNDMTGAMLMEAGADVTAINNNGSTPLHVAAWEGSIAFCFFLLNHRVPVDPINSHNVTPLHLAAMEDDEHIVHLLIARGARVNCLEDRTDSPLHYAAKFGNVFMMKNLIRAGANVSALNVEKRTPLHTAAAKGHSEACVLLIKAGSDVNALDEKNRTPLHMVAMYGGSIPVAEILLKKGANMCAIDSKGMAPWDLGCVFQNLEFSVWLENKIFVLEGRRDKGARRKKSSHGKK